MRAKFKLALLLTAVTAALDLLLCYHGWQIVAEGKLKAIVAHLHFMKHGSWGR